MMTETKQVDDAVLAEARYGQKRTARVMAASYGEDTIRLMNSMPEHLVRLYARIAFRFGKLHVAFEPS